MRRRTDQVSYFVKQELVDQAIEMVKPTFEALLGSDLVEGRKDIHIVVRESSGHQFEYTFAANPKKEWKYPYDNIAYRKALECQRTGKPSGHILHRTPWLFEEGDTRYAGGVVKDGLVVAISGLQSHFDEMLSWMIFNAITGLCMDKIAQIQKDPNSGHFLGETAT